MSAVNPEPASQPAGLLHKIFALRRADAWLLGSLTLLYLFVLRLGMFSPMRSSILAAVWPPGGVSLAALILLPRRRWPLAAATIFVSGTLATVIHSDRHLLPTAYFMAVDLFESLLCAWLMTWRCGDRIAFNRIRDVLALVVCITAVNAFTSTLGAGIAFVLGQAHFGDFFETWWISDGLGILLLTPSIVVWAMPWHSLPANRWAHFLEACLVGVTTCACAWLGFLGTAASLPVEPRPYWVFLPLVWGAWRFGVRGTTLLLVLLTAIAIGVTANGQGSFPLGGEGMVEHLRMVQLFIGSVAIILLMLAAALAERQTAEAALSEREKRLQDLFNQAGEGIFTLTPDGAIQAVNESFAKMHGYTVAELHRMGLKDLDTPETAAGIPERMSRLLAGESLTFEVEHYHKDGHAFPLEVSACLISSGGEKLIQCFHRSIADRKRVHAFTQARMRLSEYALTHSLGELLTKALDEAELLTGSTIGFFHFVEADQKTLSLQTWSTNTLRHMCTAEGKGQHYSADIAGVWVDALRERRPVIHNDYASLTYRKGLPTGHAHVLRELVVPVLQGEKIVALLGIGNKPGNYGPTDIENVSLLANLTWDVVLAKRSDEALRVSEERFRKLFEDHSAVKLIIDPATGLILDANGAAVKFYGWSLEELRRKTMLEINTFSPDEVKSAMAKARSPQQNHFEFRHRRADGSVRDVEVFSNSIEAGGRTLLHSIVHDITERKQAEMELRFSEARFRAIADHTPDHIIIHDRDLRYLAVINPSLGLTEADMLGKTDWDILAKEDAEKLIAAKKKVLETGESFHFEASLPNKQGEPNFFDGTFVPTRDAQHEIDGLIGYFRNVTERRRIEREREMFFAFFKISSDIMVIADPLGCFKRVNPAALTLLGYSEAELFGQPFINFVHPDDRQPTLDEMARQIHSGTSMNFKNRYLCKNGTIKWLEWRANYVAKESITFATARDLTAQHQSEVALRDSEQRFRNFFELTADMVCIAEINGSFREINSSFARVLGYSKEELIGHSFMDFVHPEDREKTLQIVAEKLRAGETVLRFENRYLRKDGGVVWLEWTSQPTVALGVTFAIARDVTERVTQQKKLEALLNQTERDAHIKGDLLREVNHRVTNNLTAVLGLMAFETEHLARTNTQVIEPVLDRMGQRIRGLLQVHRLLSQSSWAPVKLDQLAEQIIRAALNAASGRQPIAVAIKPTRLNVSPRQAGTLAMVFNELATNTVKHVGQPSAAVAISFEAEQDHNNITMRYRDNGPGYPPEALANQQTSVGLKLIRELIAMTLRGSVTLSNDQGAVTTIQIRQEEETRT